jgi:hypothetical protein
MADETGDCAAAIRAALIRLSLGQDSGSRLRARGCPWWRAYGEATAPSAPSGGQCGQVAVAPGDLPRWEESGASMRLYPGRETSRCGGHLCARHLSDGLPALQLHGLALDIASVTFSRSLKLRRPPTGAAARYRCYFSASSRRLRLTNLRRILRLLQSQPPVHGATSWG